MDQLSVFDKEALKIFVLLFPIPLSLGLWEKWISRCRRHWMDIYPPLYMNVYYYLYIYFSMLCRRFFRDGVWKVPRMALIKNASRVLQRMNERRAYQKTKPFFAAALCHTGNSSALGSEVLSATTTVAVTSPLLAGRVVTSSQSTWGRS
jgi:hypothetical protein